MKILDALLFTRSAACSAESVSLLSFNTYFFVKDKFNEYHGSIKPYTVDRLGKGWTVLIGLVDVQ
jgi:hypothetical protein